VVLARLHATGAWLRPAISGRSRRCARHPEHAPSTTANAPRARRITKRSAPSPIAWLACCMAV
jgi:hypothetical protein